MPLVDLCCPKCLVKNPPIRTQLQTNDGGGNFTCTAGCDFKDGKDGVSGGILDYKLESFSGRKFQPPPPPAPTNAVAISLTIPAQVKARLIEKYKEKTDLTIVAILGEISAADCFLVGAQDIARFSELLGTYIENPSVLFGVVYNAVQERNDAKKTLEDMQKAGATAGGNSAPGGFVVDLPPEAIVKIAEKAAFNGKNVRQMVSETLQFALEQGWF